MLNKQKNDNISRVLLGREVSEVINKRREGASDVPRWVMWVHERVGVPALELGDVIDGFLEIWEFDDEEKYRQSRAGKLDGDTDETQPRAEYMLTWRDAVIFHPLSSFRHWWDVLILLLTVYTLIVYPFRFAFYWDERVYDHGLVTGYAIWETVMDALYLLDVAFNFNTGYVSLNDQVIMMNRKALTLRYLRSWFAVDSAAGLPWDAILVHANDSPALSLLRLLRILRIFKLIRLIRLYFQLRYSKLAAIPFLRGRLFYLTSFLSIITVYFWWMHVNACIFFFHNSALGYPDRGWVVMEGVEYENKFKQYVHALFKAVCSIVADGYGVIPSPILTSEVLVQMGSILTSFTVYQVLQSVITVLNVRYPSKSFTYLSKWESINAYLAAKNVDPALRDTIQENIEYRARNERPFDQDTHLSLLPESVRAEVLYESKRKLFDKAKCFVHLHPVRRRDVAVISKEEVYAPGDFIVMQGQISDYMYIIERGAVEVVRNGMPIAVLNKGGFFGETFATLHELSEASYVAIGHVDVVIIHRAELEEYLLEDEEFAVSLKQISEDRKVWLDYLMHVRTSDVTVSAADIALGELEGEKGAEKIEKVFKRHAAIQRASVMFAPTKDEEDAEAQGGAEEEVGLTHEESKRTRDGSEDASVRGALPVISEDHPPASTTEAPHPGLEKKSSLKKIGSFLRGASFRRSSNGAVPASGGETWTPRQGLQHTDSSGRLRIMVPDGDRAMRTSEGAPLSSSTRPPLARATSNRLSRPSALGQLYRQSSMQQRVPPPVPNAPDSARRNMLAHVSSSGLATSADDAASQQLGRPPSFKRQISNKELNELLKAKGLGSSSIQNSPHVSLLGGTPSPVPDMFNAATTVTPPAPTANDAQLDATSRASRAVDAVNDALALAESLAEGNSAVAMNLRAAVQRVRDLVVVPITATSGSTTALPDVPLPGNNNNAANGGRQQQRLYGYAVDDM